MVLTRLETRLLPKRLSEKEKGLLFCPLCLGLQEMEMRVLEPGDEGNAGGGSAPEPLAAAIPRIRCRAPPLPSMNKKTNF